MKHEYSGGKCIHCGYGVGYIAHHGLTECIAKGVQRAPVTSQPRQMRANDTTNSSTPINNNPMSGIRDFFGFVHIAGYVGQGLLFGYIEYSILRRDIIQVINPILHVGVIFIMVQTVWFWIFLAMSIFGYFAAIGAQAKFDSKNSHYP